MPPIPQVVLRHQPPMFLSMFSDCSRILCLLLPCLLCACDENSAVVDAAQAAEPLQRTIQMPPDEPAPPDPVMIEHTVTDFARGTALGASLGARHRLTMNGLPKNSRQTAEGYWIGSLPSPDNIQELHDRNIKLILTASIVPAKKLKPIKQAMDRLGIEHIYIPFGSRFPNPSKFLGAIESYAPEQVYIHCEHGGDRSGAILAYLLTKRHGWKLPRALYAVIVPTYGDIQALTRLLNAHGIACKPEDYADDIGIYSAESNGGYGGLKVYAKDGNYVKLVNTLIDTALAKK